MSVDYRIIVKRKCDDRKIAEFSANAIKSILDSEFSEIIHCDGRNTNENSRFEYKDLETVSDNVFDKISNLYSEITNKTMMIALAKSVEVKNDIKEEMSYIKEDIEELKWVLTSANHLMGMISCVVEDLIKNKSNYGSAYYYNAKDLKSEKKTSENGEEYECRRTIWNSDVYCVVEADY